MRLGNGHHIAALKDSQCPSLARFILARLHIYTSGIEIFAA